MAEDDDLISLLRAEIEKLSREKAASRQRRSETIGELKQIVAALDQIVSTMRRLSINASIECAHVGDAGAGFAVLAQEFRTLAAAAQTAVDQAHTLLEARGRDRHVE